LDVRGSSEKCRDAGKDAATGSGDFDCDPNFGKAARELASNIQASQALFPALGWISSKKSLF